MGKTVVKKGAGNKAAKSRAKPITKSIKKIVKKSPPKKKKTLRLISKKPTQKMLKGGGVRPLARFQQTLY